MRQTKNGILYLLFHTFINTHIQTLFKLQLVTSNRKLYLLKWKKMHANKSVGMAKKQNKTKRQLKCLTNDNTTHTQTQIILQ